MDGQQSLYISGGQDNKVVKVHGDPHVDVPQLQSNQEEADGRLILHAVAAADAGAECIVVCSPDTDVLVMLIH